MNVKTPGAGRRTGAFGNGVVFAADPTEIAHSASKIQTDHLRRRFNLSPALAAVIASHVYDTAETWRAAH